MSKIPDVLRKNPVTGEHLLDLEGNNQITVRNQKMSETNFDRRMLGGQKVNLLKFAFKIRTLNSKAFFSKSYSVTCARFLSETTNL